MKSLRAKETRLRVWPYGRFSSKPQEEGDSRDRQDKAVADWITRNKIPKEQVQKTIFDTGVSGFTGANLRDGGGLAQFIQKIKDRTVSPGDVLLVENLDRLSRLKPTDAQALILRIVKAGIRIAITEGYYEITERNLNSGDGTYWRLMGEIERAHRESKRKQSLRTSAWRTQRELASKGIRTKHRCPSYLEWDEVHQCYKKIPKHSNTVKKLFKLAQKMGAMSIFYYLQDRPDEHPPFGRSGSWNSSYIKQILRDRAVLGEHIFRAQVTDEDGYAVLDETGHKTFSPVGEPIAKYYPRVIDDKLWYDVQKKLDDRVFNDQGAGDNVPNLFSGLVYCGSCGAKMLIRDARRKNLKRSGDALRVYKYYRCKAHLESRGKKCANRVSWNRDDLEKRILALLVNYLDPTLVQSDGELELGCIGNEIDSVLGEISTLRYRIDAWTEALPDLHDRAKIDIKHKINSAYYRIEQLEKQEQMLSAKRGASQMAAQEITQVQEMLAHVYTNIDDPKIRDNVRVAVSRVVSEIILETHLEVPRILVRVKGLPYHSMLMPKTSTHWILLADLKEETLLRAILNTPGEDQQEQSKFEKP